jgi:beta-mannosidase
MEYSLNGSWQLHFTDPAKGETEIPAQVPGNVIGDLHRAGLLPDPYVGTNSLLTRPYEFIDWTYITSFSTPDFDNDERVELCFEGVDTVFDLYVNGEKIGCGRNMYIEHRFDVTQYLRKDHKANQLRVKIASSVNFARCLSRPAAFDCQPYNYEGWQLRRAVHTYGWDIAPGIWRGVSLRVLKPIRWRDSYLYTQWMKDDRTGMVLHWELDTNSVTLDGYSAELEMSCGESHYRESFPMYFTSGRHYFHRQRAHRRICHDHPVQFPHRTLCS